MGILTGLVLKPHPLCYLGDLNPPDTEATPLCYLGDLNPLGTEATPTVLSLGS